MIPDFDADEKRPFLLPGKPLSAVSIGLVKSLASVLVGGLTTDYDQHMMRKLSRLWRVGWLLCCGAVAAWLLVPDWPAFGDAEYRVLTYVGLNQFDFFSWQADAVLDKAQAVLGNEHSYLDEGTRKAVVLDYLELIRRAQQVNREIEQAFANPDIADPVAVTAVWQEELAGVRAQIAARQPLAEAIVQDQVASILQEEGFGAAGMVMPPVMVHMTPLPLMLIVSPRDRIERIDQVSLVYGLPVAEQERMETAVYDGLDLSALVVPIGGLSTYPSMIMETSNINWLAEVTAHEWTHHWLTLRPLGLNYTDPQVRTINETVASIVDREVGAQVIARYYPEFVPPPPTTPETSPLPMPNAGPPPFDFRAEMEQTRIQVDQLLAAGEVAAAEAYMEARRQVFLENGYFIRKLNQAYFAFYGAYADQPGATGTDPIGPMVREVRALSPSLKAFLTAMAPIDSAAKLEALLAALQAQAVAEEP